MTHQTLLKMAATAPKVPTFEQLCSNIHEGLKDIMSHKSVEVAPIREDVVFVVNKYRSQIQELFTMVKKFLEEHLLGIQRDLEALQTDLLVAYAAKWNLYHISLRILLICFDKLNKTLSERPTQHKMRPPSSTSVRPGSRYINPPVSTPGDTSEVEKAALGMWRTILFDHFQDRLMAVALAKITEDRDASFYQCQDGESSAAQVIPVSTATLSTQPTTSSSTSNLKDSISQRNLWVPMGGDTLVSQLVESILRLGDVLPGPQKLKLYEERFERLYLLRIAEYFGRESADYITNQGITSFISLALLRLNQEELRTTRYLHVSSKAKVTSALHEVLILAHKDAMLSEFEQMLVYERKKQMHVLYSLLSRLDNGCEELKKAVADHIIRTSADALRSLLEATTTETASSTSAAARGAAAAKRKKNDRGAAANVAPQAFVDTLTQLHAKFSALISTSFNDDSAFLTTMDQAYKEVVNATTLCDDYTLGPELMARHSDGLLRKGTTALSESDLDTKLNQLVNVFKYVDDKDIFQTVYSKLLAKRLINASSVSDDTERAMIAMLKPVCSSEFILRVQKMFTDIQLSKEVSEKFRSFVEGQAAPVQEGTQKVNSEAVEGEAPAKSESHQLVRPTAQLDFSVFVLTTGSWPLQEQQSSFNMPEAISEYLNSFAAFYASLHTGRKLNWLYSLHRGEIRYLARKKYDISASAFQIGALLAFDSDGAAVLSVDQMTIALGLPPSETISIVRNLLDCKLLMFAEAESASSSHPKEEEVSKPSSKKNAVQIFGTSQLQLNPSFANKKIKFKLPPPAPTDSAKAAAQAAAKEEIDGDRSQFLQAVIVRTMKTRKTLSHTQLVQEVLDQCKSRFRANVVIIKRQIDSLIEMEYLMRSKDKSDVYQYCA